MASSYLSLHRPRPHLNPLIKLRRNALATSRLKLTRLPRSYSTYLSRIWITDSITLFPKDSTPMRSPGHEFLCALGRAMLTASLSRDEKKAPIKVNYRRCVVRFHRNKFYPTVFCV